jgi:hypothetical protein
MTDQIPTTEDGSEKYREGQRVPIGAEQLATTSARYHKSISDDLLAIRACHHNLDSNGLAALDNLERNTLAFGSWLHRYETQPSTGPSDPTFYHGMTGTKKA